MNLELDLEVASTGVEKSFRIKVPHTAPLGVQKIEVHGAETKWTTVTIIDRPEKDKSLSGTIWQLRKYGTSLEDEILELHTDGRVNKSDLRYQSWEQYGDTFYYYINDKFATYVGAVSEDRDYISGTASNDARNSWTSEAFRISNSSKPTPWPTPTVMPTPTRLKASGDLLKINGSYVRPNQVSIPIDNGYVMVHPMTAKDSSYPTRTEVTLGYYPSNAVGVVSWSGVDTDKGHIAEVFMNKDREVIATISP